MNPVRVNQEIPLVQFLAEMEDTSSLKFFYVQEWLEPFIVKPANKQLPLHEIIRSTLGDSEIGFVVMYDYAVIFYKDMRRKLEQDAIVRKAIESKVKVDQFVIGNSKKFIPGGQVTLNGIVRDEEGRVPLAGTTVEVNGLNIGTTTNLKGEYKLNLVGGEYILSFRFINYEEKLIQLSIYENGELNIDLQEASTTLEEVIVTDQSMATKRIGQSSIKMQDLSRTPAFLGEVDIIKQLQLQTGVSTVSEASNGFNVRGGGTDQNLILYDGVPIFNTSHALGFFTAFNADAVSEASFYNGGIPAEYGGRVSSVLNMASKDGSFEKWSGNFGIGFVSSTLNVGGPIKRDSSSLMLSLRSTYSDWILKLLQAEYKDVQNSSVSFFDGSLKYVQKLSNGSRLTFSSYGSGDKFKLASDTTNQWQNLALALRYDRALKSNLFYSVGLSLGQYAYQVSEEDPSTAFKLNYKITYPSLKIDFIKEGIHRQSFGFQSIFYGFQPGKLRPTSAESNSRLVEMPRENSLESAIYFSEGFNWGDRLNMEVGLRLSMFNRLGPGTVYLYEEGEPLEPRNVVDSIEYKGGIMKTYGGIEPRLSVRYALGLHSSIKLGYNRIHQYVHLVSNTATVTPVDIWQPSNTYFKPQVADQVSLGYFKDSKNNSYESFVEIYYKHTQNILDFKDGASLILNPKLETALLQGISKSYGAEFSFNKVKGRFTFGLNYTFSRSLRKVTGKSDLENINEGNYYPSNFDQPHIANFNWRLALSKKIFFSGIFTYHTGRPVSLPVVAYIIDESPVIDFSERNNYRLPDYHRLDVALVIEGNNRRRKFLEGQWTISIYNVYGRKNPYSAFFDYNVAGAVKPYQIALVGVPIPSISYSVNF